MPQYKISHPNEKQPGWVIEQIVDAYDPAIKVTAHRVGSVDVDATQQQHDDFMAVNPTWKSELIKPPVYADINKPAINLQNLRGRITSDKPQP